MRLSAPTVLIFLISLVLPGIAVVGKLNYVPMPHMIPNQEFWLAVFAYLIFMCGNVIKGL